MNSIERLVPNRTENTLHLHYKNKSVHCREETFCSENCIKHVHVVCEWKERFSNARPKVTPGRKRDSLDPDFDCCDPVLLVALSCPSRRMSGMGTERNIKIEFSSLYIQIHIIFSAKLNYAAYVYRTVHHLDS